MKDAKGHGSEGRGSDRAVPFDRSKIGMTVGAHFSDRALRGVGNQTDTQRTVADLRARMASTGPGHQSGLWQGVKNLLGG